MRLKHKKIFISGMALTVAGVLGVGALLQSSVSVQASSAMMPGIEQIVGEVSEEEPFRILEIVDSKADAEIGYYVSGQEPYIKLYEYQIKDEEGNVKETIHFSTLEEGLSKLPSGQLREEFARNVKFNTDEDGNLIIDENGNPTSTSSDIRDISDISYKGGESDSGDSVLDYPLSYTDYEEKYFLKEGESTETGWNQIDFVDFEGQPRVDKVSLAGTYVENPSGNGNYTKQEQSYYPIRQDSDDQSNDAAKFRENIQNFFYSEGDDTRAPYDLKFAEVGNDTVNKVLAGEYPDGKNPILEEYDYAQGRYGYYENVYADLITELAEMPTSFPGEKKEAEAGVSIQKNGNLATTELFSAGDAELFGSAESGSAEPDSGEEIFGADAVGDEVVYDNDTDVFSDDVFTTDTIENSEPVENIEPAEDDVIPDALADGNEDDTVKEPIILGEILNKETEGTQSNPYIYLGKAIAEYPNYKYTKVGDLAYVIAKAEESAKADKQNIEKNKPITREAGDITIENDQYWYWEQVGNVGNDLVKQPLSVVTGRQPVAYNHIRPISEELDYSYYYRVEEAYFCCKLPEGGDQKNPQSYQYFGWYFPSYPANESVYLPVEGERVPTHYISDAVYKLTPGNGNYDFVPGGEETCEVEVNHAYYRGGYANNDWLKRYVFHLSPTAQSMNSETAEEGQAVTDEDARKQFDNFAIEVDTFTAEELDAILNGAAEQMKDEYQAAVPDQTRDEYQASDTEQMESGETADVDQTENGDQVLASDQAADENQTEGEVQAPDESQTPNEDRTSDENQSSGQENGNADTNADEVMVLGEGEVSQVAPMVSEVMEELVGPQADQLFSDSDGQTQTEQVQTEQTQAEQEPDADSLFSDAENTEPEETFSSDDAAVFSSGSEAKDAENNGGFQVSDYDLIYINGNMISREVADALAASRLPCIINQEKILNAADKDNNIEQAFSAFLHKEDTDNHYVNQYIYFFRNLDEVGKVSDANLVNLNFKTPFYTESEVSDSNTLKVPEGFEEIKEYIDSENQYRGLNAEIEPLSYDISQARVVEYILNYKLKRNVKLKDKINVLEIQPANGDGVLTEKDVLYWLGLSSDLKVSACCQESRDLSIEKILDGKADTKWHSNFSDKTLEKHQHYFTVKLPSNLNTIEGITYLPRNKEKNGVAKKIYIELYNVNKEQIGKRTEVSFEYKNPNNPRELQKYQFENPINNVKYIKITFSETMGNTDQEKGQFASCAEFGVIGDYDLKLDSVKIPEIEIIHMTSSEFVGHIDDINSQYDLIYFGDDLKNWNELRNGNQIDNVKPLYSHVGGQKKENWYTKLMGLLDIDYKDFAKEDKQKQILNPDQVALQKVGYGDRAGKIGVMRGSGNDITEQQKKELMSFVNSGYPVIIEDGLVSEQEGNINIGVVDTSSYMYSFLREAISKKNVFVESKVDNSLDFFANLAKPQIVFDSMPPEPKRLNDEDYLYNKDDAASGFLTEKDEGLKFSFEIQNDAEISVANASYNCELFLDLDFDGNLANDENQYEYIQIQEADSGRVLTSVNKKYELEIGKKYVLTRKIPQDYYKVITWKLQIGNNSHSNIRTSRVGFTKRKMSEGGKKQTINVLQIKPDSSTWNLGYQPSENYNTGTFQKLLSDMSAQMPEFEITITEKTIGKYTEDYVDGLKQGKNILDNYQMLIIGFKDVYTNIPNSPKDTNPNFMGKGAVEAILQFINDGKSVLFSHDTTSFINRDENTSDNLYDTGTIASTSIWGYSLNTYLRAAVGMDRYGITSPEKVSETETVSDILKKGNELNIENGEGGKIKSLVSDMAYKFGDKTQTYLMTQGYTNDTLLNEGAGITTTVTKVNDGAITQYPYHINDTINNVAETHAQYYQLAMEEDKDDDGKNDIVVWYCLGGGVRYTQSPNDVRNNYYFYSKGNVIYTGVGHASVGGNTDIQEKQLFANAIIAAAMVTAVEPDVDFLKSFDPKAEVERNRYYMTDQHFWKQDDRNVLEENMEFYLRVKDYNMAAKSLNYKENNAGTMSLELYIENPSSQSTLNVNGMEIKADKLSGNDKVSTIQGYSNGSKINANQDGVFILEGNDTFSFTVSNIENYLKESGNLYNNNCKIHAKVTSTVSLYGKPVTKSSWAVIDLSQRQLFDLD